MLWGHRTLCPFHKTTLRDCVHVHLLKDRRESPHPPTEQSCPFPAHMCKACRSSKGRRSTELRRRALESRFVANAATSTLVLGRVSNPIESPFPHFLNGMMTTTPQASMSKNCVIQIKPSLSITIWSTLSP